MNGRRKWEGKRERGREGERERERKERGREGGRREGRRRGEREEVAVPRPKCSPSMRDIAANPTSRYCLAVS